MAVNGHRRDLFHAERLRPLVDGGTPDVELDDIRVGRHLPHPPGEVRAERSAGAEYLYLHFRPPFFPSVEPLPLVLFCTVALLPVEGDFRRLPGFNRSNPSTSALETNRIPNRS